MKKLLLILLAILILGGAGYFYYTKKKIPAAPAVNTEVKADHGAPTFEWSYKTSGDEEIPQTKITLTAKYPDGTVDAREIGEVQGGSCNNYSDPDKDVYSQSKMIICYYAGFGEYYKVVKVEEKYQVQRKEFEEGSPDYTPPEASFQTVAEF